jgi:raffinose/stachyose/melibiose transport system substrate-binding protein
MRRALVVLAVLTCAIGVVFASGKADTGAAPAAPVELQFWYPTWWDAGPEGAGSEDAAPMTAVKQFQADNPNIVIKGTPYGDPAILDNLYIASASKTGPDMYFIWLGYQQWPLVNAGFTLDLTSYNSTYKWTQKLLKGAMDSVTYKGKIWGVPFQLQSMIFWARKDMLDKYNSGKVPQTMDELRGMGDRMYADGKRLATTASLDGWQLLRYTGAFVENYVGVDYMNKLLNLEGTWDTPQVVQALKELKLWGEKYFQPGFQGIKPGDAKIEFYNGNAAIQYEGAWIEGTLKTDGYADLPVVGFPIPTDSKPWRINSFPEQLSVTTMCKNPDAAVKFIDYIAKLETANKYAAAFSWTPAAIGYKFGPDQPLHQQVNDLQTKYGAYPPWDGGLPMEFANVVYEVQDNVIAGKMTPEQGAKRLQQGMEEYKAKQKK